MTRLTTLLLLLLLLAGSAWSEGTSTSHVWAPTRPVDGTSVGVTAAGEQRCYAWIPELGLTSGTTIGWYITTGFGGGKLCTVTLYSGDGNTQITTTGPQDCSTSGLKVVTGLTPYSFASGSKLQVCACGTAGGSFLGPTTGPLNDFRSLRNGLTAPLQTSSANTCTAGVPPATLGVLSGTLQMPFTVLFATGTP